MSDRAHHSEWLSLIDVSGPFLAEPVLKEAFPQGLGGLDTAKKTMLRQAYDEWREARDLDDPLLPKLHEAWIGLVLKQGLELDEQGKSDVLKPRAALPETLAYELPEHGVTLRPDYAVVAGDGTPLMLVAAYGPDVSLNDAKKGDAWAAAPAERMVELCRATQVRLGLVTNGEHWMFVDAPVNAATSMANWYARLWGQEPLTLQAFVNLLGVRRFFVDRSEQLPALLDKSLEHQDEVTDALGEQVRRAVEVLIQALERADVDRKRELLEGIEPAELYEAGLTVMMRIVFLLSAEERGLLLMGDPRYEAYYAISTLRLQLRVSSDEILERRQDAWSRLLAVFRAVYGGIDHNSMRLPALGGSLFDPDRYPFLEGRAKGSSWKSDPAMPLPIDDRTVLLLLEAVQLFRGRTLSYLALDVEQIGYVYEGLLERTAVRATEVTLDLAATKNADNSWVSLPELDDAAAKGGEAVEELLKERTGSAATRVRNDLARKVDDASAERLLAACHGDRELRDRVKPYFHLLRTDPWGYPLVYPKSTFMVRTGSDRRETGTHYTPRSFTEIIVRDTLEPVVYSGPAQAIPRESWKLKSPAELLNIKVCDPTMGSGAFLVQVCRWLSERLVEAWAQAEHAGKTISSDGHAHEDIGSRERLQTNPEERLLTAKRLIAERCLYGVDVNPLAVELAKLSIWLVTLSKGRPFGFLDHNLRSGDSLLGITQLDQLNYLGMDPDRNSSKMLFASAIDKTIAHALQLRRDLRSRQVRDIRDVDLMESLELNTRRILALPVLIADILVAEAFIGKSKDLDKIALSIEVGAALNGDQSILSSLASKSSDALNKDLPEGQSPRRPFHWPLEFPEVFYGLEGGFDAIVGNPPFKRGKLIRAACGEAYRNYLVKHVAGKKGSANLVVYFLLMAHRLARPSGSLGLITAKTISEGETREVGLDSLLNSGTQIYRACRSINWPGSAQIVVALVCLFKGSWKGLIQLDGRPAAFISPFLTDKKEWTPMPLRQLPAQAFQGVITHGDGFEVGKDLVEALASRLYIDRVLFPYLNGDDVCSHPDQLAGRSVICFWDWPFDRSATGSWETMAPSQQAKLLADGHATSDYPGFVVTDFPELKDIVESTVRPHRQQRDNKGAFKLRKPLPQKWWQFSDKRPGLYHHMGMGDHFASHPSDWNPGHPPLEKVIVRVQSTKHHAFAFVTPKQIINNTLNVIASEDCALFALLSSEFHASWFYRYGSNLGVAGRQSMGYPRYYHTEVYGTFPFKLDCLTKEVENIGEAMLSLRTEWMRSKQNGLTSFYNLLHSPLSNDETISQFRRLCSDLERMLSAAYGWADLDVTLDFHLNEYLPTSDNLRYTFSSEVRQQLLLRFSELNRAMYHNELAAAASHGRSASTIGNLL